MLKQNSETLGQKMQSISKPQSKFILWIVAGFSLFAFGLMIFGHFLPNHITVWLYAIASVLLYPFTRLILYIVSHFNPQTTTPPIISQNSEETINSSTQQAIFVELGRFVLESKDSVAFAQTICDVCQHLYSLESIDVMHYDHPQKLLKRVAFANQFSITPEQVEVNAQQRFPAVTSILTQQMVNVPDIPKHSLYNKTSELVTQQNMACTSIPIVGIYMPYGVINLYYSKDRFLSESDFYFLQSLSNLIGILSQRLEAEKTEQIHNKQSETLREISVMLLNQVETQEIFDKILEYVQENLPNCVASSIGLITNDKKHFNLVATKNQNVSEDFKKHISTFPLRSFDKKMEEQGYVILPNISEEKDWFIHPDTAWIQSYLGVAIIAKDELIGLINIDSDQLNAFTKEDAMQIVYIADKVGMAIQNNRQAEELSNLVHERTEQIKQEREQLQSILDTTGEGIYYTDNGRILFVNEALCTMTGYTPLELIDKPSSLLHPERTDTAVKFKIKDHQQLIMSKIWHEEGKLKRKDGTFIDAEFTMSRIIKEEITYHKFQAVTIVRDISLRKKLEEQHQRFIANAAHELRSPITNLNTRLYFIEKKPEEMPKHIEMLKLIINRMNRLVADLLDMSYIEKGNIAIESQNVIIQELLETTLSLAETEAEQKQITIQKHFIENPVNIIADPHRLMQVFVNLINNAIHYTPEKGCLIIHIKKETQYVVVGFEDNGRGIAQEDLQKIFEPFYRVESKTTGTGLGLSISKEIVELHEGEIWVESELEKGSTFWVRLPLNQ
jgi:PAS domain S-box-containing protein